MTQPDLGQRLNTVLAKAKADPDRQFWFSIRQALLQALSAIEKKLGTKQSVTPKHKTRG